jgi:hypothetical protein
MAIYALYPNISDLTFEWNTLLHLSDYLRPNLHSLTIVFPLHLDTDNTSMTLRRHCFIRVFEGLKNYLESPASSTLANLRIKMHREVTLFMESPLSVLTHYDADGPVYEDQEIVVKTDKIPASHYLSLLGDDDRAFLEDTFVPLATSRIFKTLRIPRGFVSDDVLPEAVKN